MSRAKTSMVAILPFLIAVSLTSASAQEESTVKTSPNGLLPLACAARDVQLVAQLEHEANSKIFEKLFSAIMRARQACYEARVTEGLELYDSALVGYAQ